MLANKGGGVPCYHGCMLNTHSICYGFLKPDALTHLFIYHALACLSS